MTKHSWVALTFIFFMAASSAFGQTKQDSTLVAETPKEKWIPKPKKAALLSLIPAAGQIYNRKLAFVKVPIIYGAFIGVGIWAADNQNAYATFRDALILEVNGEPHQFGNATATDLRRARDAADKNRQRTYIALGAIYLAQVVEAYVAAHLIDFDIDDDLSLKLKPTVQPEYDQSIGFGAVLSF